MRRFYPSDVDSTAQNGLLKWTLGLHRERAYHGEGIPALHDVLFDLSVIIAAALVLALGVDLLLKVADIG